MSEPIDLAALTDEELLIAFGNALSDLRAAIEQKDRGVVTDDLRGKLLREVPPGLDGALKVLDLLLSGGDRDCGDWGGVGFCQIDRDAFAFVRAELVKAQHEIARLREAGLSGAERRRREDSNG